MEFIMNSSCENPLCTQSWYRHKRMHTRAVASSLLHHRVQLFTVGLTLGYMKIGQFIYQLVCVLGCGINYIVAESTNNY